VVKGIICSNANHRHFGVNRRQKLRAGRRFASVVWDFGDSYAIYRKWQLGGW
jgi:hypothetical protein